MLGWGDIIDMIAGASTRAIESVVHRAASASL